MAYYTDPRTGTTYTSPEVAAQYGVSVPSGTSSGTTIQQQTAAANQSLINQGINIGTPTASASAPSPGGATTSTGQSTTYAGGGTITPAIPPPLSPIPISPAPSTKIDTSQPNPATVNATPSTGAAESPTFFKPDPNSPQVVNAKGEKLSYDQYIAQGGKADFSNVKAGLASGLAEAQASGPAPQDAGSARTMVDKLTPKTQANPIAQTESLLAQSPEYAKWLADVNELNSIQNQGKTLLDFYNKAVQEAGIPAIDKELINTKSIIEGTEDDIRKEVQAAGGFATDSQVLALSQARNKTLIKNYNVLIDTKNMAMQQINNMTNLASQDRDYAMQAINQKLQIDQQALQIKSQMISSAQEGYNNVIQAVGYNGFLQMLGNDPHSIAIAEQTLGFAPGGLTQLATYTQNQSNLQNLSQYNISTPYIINAAGEVQNTQTGLAYSSPEDFQAKTGMTLDQAGQKGLIKPLGQTIEAQQQNFENQMKLEGLNIQQQQLGISAGNLGLARQKFQYDMLNDQLNSGQLDDKTLGKIQSSPDYKTISALLPAVQTIKQYKDMVAKHGTFALGGTAKGELDSAYGNALAAWKTLAGLGALSGADFELAENAIPKPGLFIRNSTALARLQGSLDNAVQQSESLTKRLTGLYPTGNSLLQQQLDDILVHAYPDRYKVGPDGQVYEITN